jgi:hypothetical protein
VVVVLDRVVFARVVVIVALVRDWSTPVSIPAGGVTVVLAPVFVLNLSFEVSPSLSL